MGRKVGAWITYSKKGMFIEKGLYKNDFEEGPWNIFLKMVRLITNVIL